MSCWRSALIVALCTGSAALVGSGGCWLGEPSPAKAEAHRVELQVSALDAALWFVDRYPEYLASGEAGLLPWLSTLEPSEQEFVLAMAQTLAWRWAQQEADELPNEPGASPEALARAAVLVVRTKTLSQLELDVDRAQTGEGGGFVLWASIDEPAFAPGVFARLVRGVSNCDGQNHALALLMDVALRPRPPWHGFSLRADLTGLNGHALTMIHGPGLDQPVFVDAWSNLPPFTLEPGGAASTSLADLDGGVPLIEGLVGREPAAPAEYARARAIELELLPPRDAPSVPVSLDIQAPALDERSLALIDDPWRLYAYARVLHLFGDPRASAVYERVLAAGCEQDSRSRPFPCQAAMGFLAPREADDAVLDDTPLDPSEDMDLELVFACSTDYGLAEVARARDTGEYVYRGSERARPGDASRPLGARDGVLRVEDSGACRRQLWTFEHPGGQLVVEELGCRAHAPAGATGVLWTRSAGHEVFEYCRAAASRALPVSE